jgi:hypothetical protein
MATEYVEMHGVMEDRQVYYSKRRKTILVRIRGSVFEGHAKTIGPGVSRILGRWNTIDLALRADTWALFEPVPNLFCRNTKSEYNRYVLATRSMVLYVRKDK